MCHSNKIVSIEGIVGAGKTTIVNILAHNKKDNKFVSILEPVEYFSSFQQRFNPLYESYVNPEKNAVCSQLHIINSLFEYYPKKFQNINNKIIFCDRCLLSPFVFIEANYKLSIFSKFTKHFLQWYLNDKLSNAQNDVYNPDLYIYLNISPELAVQRIKERNREGEIFCSESFLKVLHQSYINFLYKQRKPCCVIPVNEADTPLEIAEKVKVLSCAFLTK